MPKIEHEAVVDLFRRRPALATDLLREMLDAPVPDHDYASLGANDCTETRPIERRVDCLVVHNEKQPESDPKKVLAVVVEVQCNYDADKRWSWPYYVTAVRTRLETPTQLLIISPYSGAIAKWCAEPIETGHPNFALAPLVIGPNELPPITDPQEAERDMGLAALSALANSKTEQGPDIMNALLEAAYKLDPEWGGGYPELIKAALPKEIWKDLEGVLKVGSLNILSESSRRTVAETRATAVLSVLEARGLDVPEDVREEINSCKDPYKQEAWLRAAVTVESARDLLR